MGKARIRRSVRIGAYIVAALCFCQVSAWAQIAVDNAANLGVNTSASSISTSYTVNSDTNGLLTVCASSSRDTLTVSGVTYNAVALTKVTELTDGARYVSLWQLTDTNGLVTGAHTLAVTYSGAGAVGASAVSFTGVDQTTPLSNAATNSGVGEPSTVTVTSAAAKLVIDCLVVLLGNTPVVGAGQTERSNQVSGDGDGYASSTEAGAASVAMTWTWDGGFDNWTVAGASINAAAAATAAPTRSLMGVGK